MVCSIPTHVLDEPLVMNRYSIQCTYTYNEEQKSET